MLFETHTPTPPTADPIAAPQAWTAVMARANRTCECTGACGTRHSKSGLRCDIRHGQYLKGSKGPVRITIGQPGLNDHEAAAPPPAELAAWCPSCWRGADRRRRASHQAFADRQTVTDTLF
ncbi:hypothetical protein ACIG5E_39025 [Kitasatospora sp. NPDC053057]|uniref:hypothetical protein n=1 Tax=Kitasatospora sp. NPDC053057 TaxID=3364062 RepID=UPI0037C92C96